MFGTNTKQLKQEIESKDALILQLQTELQDYRKSMTSFSNQKMEYEGEKTKLMDAHKAETQLLKQQIEMEKKSVAKKVNAELSAIGVSQFVPEEISLEGLMQSPESILERFTSMPESPEKHEFFKAHEKIISKAMKGKTQ